MQFDPMKRREFITLIGGAAMWSRTARAQSEPMRRVGVLAPFTSEAQQTRIAAFREELARLGWSEGRNLRVDYRWGGASAEFDEDQARELLALAPEVIVSQSTRALRLLSTANRNLPVVVANAADLVEMGMVESLAHPGGNVTGFILPEFSIAGKWLELLRAIAPRIRRVLNIYYAVRVANGERANAPERFVAATKASADPFGIEVLEAPVRNAADITAAIESFARTPNGGLIVHPTPIAVAHRELLIALAARHGLPAMYPNRRSVETGGLISYGINLVERWRSAAGYVDLILRGARAADLPVQSTSRLELAINVKSAQALGLTVPPHLLAGADEVIE
jgi:putative ABC transport system substrate-binding protein